MMKFLGYNYADSKVKNRAYIFYQSSCSGCLLTCSYAPAVVISGAA